MLGLISRELDNILVVPIYALIRNLLNIDHSYQQQQKKHIEQSVVFDKSHIGNSKETFGILNTAD